MQHVVENDAAVNAIFCRNLALLVVGVAADNTINNNKGREGKAHSFIYGGSEARKTSNTMTT